VRISLFPTIRPRFGGDEGIGRDLGGVRLEVKVKVVRSEGARIVVLVVQFQRRWYF
jgi:hypothetical protein